MSDPALALATQVDPKETAVRVVDVQEVFVRFPTLYPPVAEVLLRLQRSIDAARAAGALVVHVQTVIPQELYAENWQRPFPAPRFTWRYNWSPIHGVLLATCHRCRTVHGITVRAQD